MSFDTLYRPLKFGDVVGQKGTIQILKNLILQDKVFHKSYIFAGPSGTGKTTTARILARAMLCDNVDPQTAEPCNTCQSCREIIEGSSSFNFVEMDAANHSGVDTIRSIISQSDYHTLGGKSRKIYLIDECFTEDTQVMTEIGLKSIKEVVETRYSGRVLSYDAETQREVWKPVTDWFDIPDEREVLRLTFDNGVEITVTLNQDIYTTNRGWVKACELTEQDDICEAQFSTVELPVDSEGKVPCLCGCENLIDPRDSRNRPKKFFKSHGNALATKRRPSRNWVKEAENWNSKKYPCQCGCGQPLQRTESQLKTRYIPKYLPGHNQRKVSVSDLTEEETSIIYGTLLGDTSILKPHSTATPRLTFNHGDPQEGYARHKTEVLSRLGWSLKSKISQGYSKGSILWNGVSSCLPALEPVYNLVTSNGKKEVTQQWLNRLDLRSLAYWYMDDGSLSKYKGEPYSCCLHTEGFSEYENYLITSWLKASGYDKVQRLESKGYSYVYIPRESCLAFLQDVKPFVHPSMQYKLGV